MHARAALLRSEAAESQPMIETDPCMPEIEDDPLPIYARLREQYPIDPLERRGGLAPTHFSIGFRA